MKTRNLVMLMLSFIFSITLSGQIIDVKGKIKNQTINRANQRTDQGIDKGLDKVEEGVVNVVKGDKKDKKDNKESTDENSEENSDSSDEGENSDEETKTDSKSTTPKLESYSKYDFIPGEKIIFFDDFSQDAVGDFPALWNTSGSAEVVTTNLYPGNWMKFITDEAIWTDKLLDLPENYTVEFDVIPIAGEDNDRMEGYVFRLIQCINTNSFDGGAVPGKAGFMLHCAYYGTSSYRSYINSDEGNELGLDGSKEGEQYKQKEDQKYHIAIWMQKSRIRLYLNEYKLFDLPKAFPLSSVKMDRLRFEEGAAMVSNIRVAVGAPDMRNKLLTEGKLVSYGIYFDVNKDEVKPESYGTLKEIAKVLTENPDVNIKIVGHTDGDGDAAKNLDLSKRRAASVKAELEKTFGIDGSRIETDGAGETQPVAGNDTPENKAKNRRVEFLKL